MQRMLAFLLAIAGVMSARALAEDTPPSEDEARRARVFAKVGDTTITVGDLEDLVAERSPSARQRLANPNALKELADSQVEGELYYQGALELGYAEADQVQRFTNQTLVKVFVRKDFEEPVTPDDVPADQVAKYFEEHPEEFRRPEMRRARHILVSSKTEAKDILKQLNASEGPTFRALAKQKSLDSETNIRGGDLLFFTDDGNVVGREAQGKIDPTLAKAAFALEKTGDLSAPLRLGEAQWSVLELTGIRPERVKTLEQASGLIRRKLWREEREGALDALIAELRAEVKPEVHPERLDAIVLEAAKEPETPQK